MSDVSVLRSRCKMKSHFISLESFKTNDLRDIAHQALFEDNPPFILIW